MATMSSRYHTLGGISSPTVAAVTPQTPSSSFNRPQFKAPFFVRSEQAERPAIYNVGGDCNAVPSETPATPQLHYGQQYAFRPPPLATTASPKTVAPARYGMAEQMPYSHHYPEQLIARDSLAPMTHVRPSMHCEPPQHYGVPSNNRPGYETADRRQPPYRAQMQQQQYDETAADSRTFAHAEGAAVPKRHYHEIEQMWKGLDKDVTMKEVPTRQYHNMEPMWKGPDQNIRNVVLKDNNTRPNERQYKEHEGVGWNGMAKGAMLKDGPNRQHQESGFMRGGIDNVASISQSLSTEFTPKNDRYNYDQNINMYATKSVKEDNVNSSPIVMVKAESKLETVQQNKSFPQADNFRVLSGPLIQVIKWEKMREEVPSLFEVVAPFVAVHPSSLKGDKMVILREKSCPAMQCLFQEIDRPLPTFRPGQLVRCVGKMLTKNKMRAYSIRSAQVSEKASLQRLQFICNRVLHEAAEGSEPPPSPN